MINGNNQNCNGYRIHDKQMNKDNPNNVRHDTCRHFRNQNREHLRDKINEFETQHTPVCLPCTLHWITHQHLQMHIQPTVQHILHNQQQKNRAVITQQDF